METQFSKSLVVLATIASLFSSSIYASDGATKTKSCVRFLLGIEEEDQSRSALEKREEHWRKTLATRYELHELPTAAPKALDFIKLLNPVSLTVSFVSESDKMKQGRRKTIHPYGVVAKAKVRIVNQTEFTGFDEEDSDVLIRLSSGTAAGTVAPGIAVKAYRNGRASVNYQAIQSLDGQAEKDFFLHPLTSAISPPTKKELKPLALAFKLATKMMRNGPDSEFVLPQIEGASTRQDGSVVQNPVAPYARYFVPRPELLGVVAPADDNFRREMTKIPAGTVLYDIYVKKTATSELVRVSELVLETDLVPSQFGDEDLFFKHQKQTKVTE